MREKEWKMLEIRNWAKLTQPNPRSPFLFSPKKRKRKKKTRKIPSLACACHVTLLNTPLNSLTLIFLSPPSRLRPKPETWNPLILIIPLYHLSPSLSLLRPWRAPSAHQASSSTFHNSPAHHHHCPSSPPSMSGQNRRWRIEKGSV